MPSNFAFAADAVRQQNLRQWFVGFVYPHQATLKYQNSAVVTVLAEVDPRRCTISVARQSI